MKTLIITAHPSPHGFTHKIASACAKILDKKKQSYEIIDLYQDENRQNFLTFENAKEIPFDPSVKRMQNKISESNELIFIFPLWWYGEPAIMKNFWDKNFSARFAYRYINGHPVGLLKGKTARVFLTSDSPIYYQWLLFNPIWIIWKITRLRFCGIKLKSFTIFGSMRFKNEKDRKKLLQKVKTKISN